MTINWEMIDFQSFARRSVLRGEYNCIINSELANQRATKALFPCVVYKPKNVHRSPLQSPLFPKTKRLVSVYYVSSIIAGHF